MLGVTTLAIAFNWLGALQRDVPGYTSALEDHIESTGSACTQLQHLSGEHQNQFAAANADSRARRRPAPPPTPGNSQSGHLAAGRTTTTTTTTTRTADHHGTAEAVGVHGQQDEPAGSGPGPELHRDHGLVQHARRTSRSRLSQLRGKVVLVDFWTYSCINCQRALPHVEGWYNDYKNDGLVVVGVSAPGVRLRARRVQRRERGGQPRASTIRSPSTTTWPPGTPTTTSTGRRTTSSTRRASCAPTTSARAATAAWRTTSGCSSARTG